MPTCLRLSCGACGVQRLQHSPIRLPIFPKRSARALCFQLADIIPAQHREDLLLEIRKLVPQGHRRDYDLYNSLVPSGGDLEESNASSPHRVRRKGGQKPVIDEGYRGRTATLATTRSAAAQAKQNQLGEASSGSLTDLLSERRHSESSKGRVREGSQAVLKIRLIAWVPPCTMPVRFLAHASAATQGTDTHSLILILILDRACRFQLSSTCSLASLQEKGTRPRLQRSGRCRVRLGYLREPCGRGWRCGESWSPCRGSDCCRERLRARCGYPCGGNSALEGFQVASAVGHSHRRSSQQIQVRERRRLPCRCLCHEQGCGASTLVVSATFPARP